MLDPFHLQRVNKLYRKYKPGSGSPKKNICWYGTQKLPKNLNLYLRNYQTETAIFPGTKHEKTIMACSCLIFSIQKIHQNSENGGFCEEVLDQNHFEAVLVNFCCYKYDANTSEPVQKHRLAQGHCWSYASSLNS